MPTTYTHYRYGRDVLATLPKPLRESIEKHREIFDLGCHGPDILFYNMNPKKTRLNHLGSMLHKVPSTVFFSHALQVLEQAEDKAAARAYIYGFICHFSLDSQTHGYVEKMIHESGIGHNEIEMEFDRALLVEDKIQPASFKRSKLIKAQSQYARVIAPFFTGLTVRTDEEGNQITESVSPADILTSLKGMQRILNILTAATPTKRLLLKALMKATKQYEDKFGIIVSLTPNKNCSSFNALMRSEYSGAIPVGVSLILQFQKALMDGDALSNRYDLTFGPGEDWMRLSLSR